MKILLCFCCLLMILFCLPPADVNAQELKISGTLTSERTGEVLPGANIAVLGTSLGTTSDFQGKFSLQLTGMTQATLVVSFVGYKTIEVPVASSKDDLSIKLEEDILKLSEVVSTGFASSVKRENLANTVATISADELIGAPAQTLDQALAGKFAGINVSQNTGAPGGGISVTLRGLSTIEGATQPLYVVDGVIVNNAATQSGIDLISKASTAGSATPQGQPVNRIADINPNEIQNIEVLKGASAAALYGSKATNGVVLITTKQGLPGITRINVNHQTGFTSLLNDIGTRTFDSYLKAVDQYGADVTAQGLNSTGLAAYNALKAQIGSDSINNLSSSALNALFGGNWAGRNIDYEDVMYGENGLINESNVSITGGTERTQFYASGLYRNENGIIKETGYEKYAGRVNVNHAISDRVKVNVRANHIRSESDRAITGNDNTNTTLGFSLAFTPSFLDIRPVSGVYPDHVFNPSNPIHTRDVLVNKEIVRRTIGSLQLSWNIFQTETNKLDFIGQGGVDFYSQENTVFSPPELQFEKNSSEPGASLLGDTKSTNANLYLNLVHGYTTSSNLVFKTSAGVQIENQDLNSVLNEARGIVVTQTNIDQASSINAFQNVIKQRELGFYGQEEVNIQDKIFLTAGVRADASSVNGDPDKFFFFPKFSGSIRLSRYDFWESLSSLASEFKLRIAYGETGNLPPPIAKFTSLVPSNIGGFGGLLPDTRRGASDIRPERAKELEFGFDATLFRGDASLEFTYYRKSISDLLLIAALPPSSGFEDEFINGGEMTTKGVEVSLGATPFRGENFRWTSRLNFFKTTSEITQLDVDPFNKGGFATFLGTYRIEEGISPTTIIGADVDANGKNIEIGNETPDFQMSFNNTFTLGNFDLGFLWEWKQGGDVINLGKLITDLGGTSKDYDEPGQFNIGSSSGGDSIVTMPSGAGRLAVLGRTTKPYVEDGTYLKLREVSLTYSVPQSVVLSLFGGQLSYLRIGVSGRNLLLFSGYDGYDPEVSQFGNIPIGRSVDTIPYPSTRSYYFNISLGI